MKRVRILACSALLTGVFAMIGNIAAHADAPAPSLTAPLLRYEVVHEYPHQIDAYTEGLVYSDGHLYESTGLVGQSSLRKTELRSGKVLQEIDIPAPHFGEGLAKAGSRWLQLTWTSGEGFVYDDKLRRIGSFPIQGEGWGLAYDGHHLIQSNGSPLLQLLDPESFAVVGKLIVHDQEQAIAGLNELEFVPGTSQGHPQDRIYANIWQTDRIAVIDAASGSLHGWLDLSALRRRFTLPAGWNPREDVLNGIAWDPRSGHLFVTGKCWPKLFEIAIAP
jgi:glutaminyl-peptide cyclotransferase